MKYMKKQIQRIFSIGLAGLIILSAPLSFALEPVGSDSRIRTLIYGKNDVFKINVATGYQTVIEMEEGERIKTISTGNSGFFKITPHKNKLFLKALQGGQLTNMTVITNRRSYQLEITSIIEDKSDLVYVVRFYYPDSQVDSFAQGAPAKIGVAGVSDFVQQTVMPGGQAQNYNYNYSLTGPQPLSPIEVFDDGQNIYVKFATMVNPIFRKVVGAGKELPTQSSFQNGYYVIPGLAPVVAAYFGSENICIYNENLTINLMQANVR
jgi:type IV secretion system protein VirB9